METPFTLSACIVSYNSRKEIAAVLDTLIAACDGIPTQIFVSDNGSVDGTPDFVREKYPQVTVVENRQNLGFGGGHNAVIPLLSSRCHLIVNPDIVIHQDTLRAILAFLDTHPDVGMLCPRILNQDGTEQVLPKRDPKLRYLLARRLPGMRKWADEYTRRNEVLPDVADIEFCTGCFMAIRTEKFVEVGGFDPRYFMYFEDADLSRTVRKTARVVMLRTVAVTHRWERASAHNYKLLRIHIQSMFKYLKKWKRG